MVKAIGTTRNLEQPQLESAPVAVAASPKDRIRKPKVAPTESRANPCRISHSPLLPNSASPDSLMSDFLIATTDRPSTHIPSFSRISRLTLVTDLEHSFILFFIHRFLDCTNRSPFHSHPFILENKSPHSSCHWARALFHFQTNPLTHSLYQHWPCHPGLNYWISRISFSKLWLRQWEIKTCGVRFQLAEVERTSGWG